MTNDELASDPARDVPDQTQEPVSQVTFLARRQHGLITFSQLRDMGWNRTSIRARLNRDEWTEAAYGVLRVGGAPVTWHSQLMAHVLAAGTGAMASHRSAAVLWGFDGHRPGTPEVSAPRNRHYRPRSATVHVSTDLHLVKPTNRSGIPTTPVTRTLLDLGAVVPRKQVHLAVDDARRRRLTDWDPLLNTLVAHARRGRRGVGHLRAILDEHRREVVATESGFERLVLIVLRQAGLPAPELQHEVLLASRRYRLDLAYPDVKVAIELDGSHHLRRDVWEADRARQNALVLAGWTVLRFTWRDYKNRRTALVKQVRAALAASTSRSCV